MQSPQNISAEKIKNHAAILSRSTRQYISKTTRMEILDLLNNVQDFMEIAGCAALNDALDKFLETQASNNELGDSLMKACGELMAARKKLRLMNPDLLKHIEKTQNILRTVEEADKSGENKEDPVNINEI